jgi:predicted negative regulator of RcsB-dependent stress response
VSRITRKELKTDKFALEVEHTVTFFEEHRKELIRYGVIALVVVLLGVGYTIYSRRQHAARQAALARAIQVQETPVGVADPTPGVRQSFPTQEAKDQVALKTFQEVAATYSGSDEGVIAQYYVGAIQADQGKLAEAEKNFKGASEQGDAHYASLAKLSLAEIYFADGRDSQGEAVLRDLMANPTIFVSKEQATLRLARHIGYKKPAEARKLVEPLQKVTGAVSEEAIRLLAELPPA